MEVVATTLSIRKNVVHRYIHAATILVKLTLIRATANTRAALFTEHTLTGYHVWLTRSDRYNAGERHCWRLHVRVASHDVFRLFLEVWSGCSALMYQL
jgi:hypothetical protein